MLQSNDYSLGILLFRLGSNDLFRNPFICTVLGASNSKML